MSRVIVPTNNVDETKCLENLVMDITADDTPSRHPCKIRISPWRGNGHRFDPYRAKVISCAMTGALEDPEEDEEEELKECTSVATDAFEEVADYQSENHLYAGAQEAPTVQYTAPLTSSYYTAPPQHSAVDTTNHFYPDQPQQPVYSAPQGAPWLAKNTSNGSTPTPTYGNAPHVASISPSPYEAADPQQQATNTYLGYTPQACSSMAPTANVSPQPTTSRGYHTFNSSNSRARCGSTMSHGSDGATVSPPATPYMGGMGSASNSFARASSRGGTPPPTTQNHGGRGAVVKYGIIVFKHLKDTFFIPSTERQGIAVGDYIVVEGDRGENVGQLIEDVTPTHQRHDPIAGRVVRKATLADRRLWENARRREVEGTAVCQAFAEDFDVDMVVDDTEFQTDLNKLTVYYHTLDGAPVDFRQMQRALFKHYRCRIWFVDQTNTPPSK